MWMRGGTSKGGLFLSDDLPDDKTARDAFLLSVMGSPDLRQIDGMGGGDPLTSKVGVVKASSRQGVDVDYLFLQVNLDKPVVSDAQNCGNILVAVGPFAIERGLVDIQDAITDVTVYMENTGKIAVLRINTPNGQISYDGNCVIDGVPGSASPIAVDFQDIAGSSCGALLPTGRPLDIIDDVTVTCIDNGMPIVILRASDFGISGKETREQLDQNDALKTRLEHIRLQAGPMMNLGDVSDKTVPKMTLISPPTNGGHISTRSFIPHRCHASIGVLAAVSVASATLLDGSPAADMAKSAPDHRIAVEHPLGLSNIILGVDKHQNVVSAALERTARKLFDGIIFA
jgi:4-oxalomesaconate tautomerase